ncbi:hypothetical protein FRB94_003113 [Tulasnella sp. JGI-2019a]|nr:hypothetical protein FRB94_003113 [Tulasnella sp. JGI-2019a]
MPVSTFFGVMSMILVILACSLNITAQVTVGVQDPQLIYSLPGGVNVNNNMDLWTNSTVPFSDACGGVIGAQNPGNSVTLMFTGTSVTATLLSALDSSLAVQLFVDGVAIKLLRTQDNSLGSTDFATCAPLTITSDPLAAGTHNATLVQLDPLGGWMFFHNFVYTPLPDAVTATVTAFTTLTPTPTPTPISSTGSTSASSSTPAPTLSSFPSSGLSTTKSSTSDSPASTTAAAVAATASTHSPVGAIVGVVIGLLVIAILVALWFWRRKRQQRETDDDMPEYKPYGGGPIRRRSSGDQIYKDISPITQPQRFSFARGQTAADARYVDLEAMQKPAAVASRGHQQRPSAAPLIPITTTRDSLATSNSSSRILAAPSVINHVSPPPSSAAATTTTDSSQERLELIERLVNQNVPRQDIAAVIRSMAAAELSGGSSGSKGGRDMRKAAATQRQRKEIYTPEEGGIEMSQRGQEEHAEAPPMYDFKDGRRV